ncbi:endonuclease domain-containing protein [Maricaulis sp.]|uniref:endonuclease domain-containing protein n=1 Tax=Maricaulis sp. TaxID=1486257 RepID=UPI003A8DCA4D
MEMTQTHLTTTELARRRRKTMPLASRILWQRLRAGRIAGHKFRRQHPISGYIVDFACLKHKLVIEIEPNPRPTGEALQRDRRRMLDLMHEGWTVLRLAESDIFNRQDQVIATITRHLEPGPDRQAASMRGEQHA